MTHTIIHLLPSSANFAGFLPARACGFVGLVGRLGAATRYQRRVSTRQAKSPYRPNPSSSEPCRQPVTRDSCESFLTYLLYADPSSLPHPYSAQQTQPLHRQPQVQEQLLEEEADPEGEAGEVVAEHQYLSRNLKMQTGTPRQTFPGYVSLMRSRKEGTASDKPLGSKPDQSYDIP